MAESKRLRLQSENNSGTLFIKKQFLVDIEALKEARNDATCSTIPKRKKGQNKAKDRSIRKAKRTELDICFTLVSSGSCERGENCKYSHDIAAFLERKGPDIEGDCPIASRLGNCRYGIKCRFLSSHDRLVSSPKPLSIEVFNTVSRDMQKEIRSRSGSHPKSDAFENVWMEAHPKQKTEEHISEIDFKDVRIRPQEKKRLDFRGKTYLAPLSTVGNLPFRRICKEFGVDITCAEMAMTNNLLQGVMGEWALMKRHESEDIFGVQITGNHPVSFAKVCEAIDQNLKVDFVDINLGCPVDAITSKQCGSALMERKSKLREMIIGANYALSCPLTVKIRTAVRDKAPLAHKLIPMFQECGVAGITLHGRSKEQRYSKLADWDYIKECSNAIDRSKDDYPFFFGNGDAFDHDEYHSLKSSTNVDGIMVARGALIKPWIFKEIKEGKVWDISANERLDILKKYANYGMNFWGSDSQGIQMTRRFMCEWLSFLHRYVPVGLIEVLPQKMNLRPERFVGRNDLETLMASSNSADWIRISEMILGKAPGSFTFIPKHRSSSY